MNTNRHWIIVSMISFCMAFIFYAFYHQWIIFRLPCNNTIASITPELIQKKSLIFYYFHDDKWKTEKQEMLWSDDKEKNILHIINAWLTVLDEEHITTKKTTLQSVLITSSDHAYLSFDRTILNKEETIFKKWILVEGLLKTLKENDIAITHVQFLVQHQPLQDPHLDFSLPWPIHGFIK